MDRFSQHMAQLKAHATRPEIAPLILMLAMLPGIVIFALAGAQMMTSMFGGLGVSLLLVGPLLTATVRSKAALRQATLLGAALIAYACGTHIAIHQLGLARDSAAAFDTLAGATLLILGAAAAICHMLWRALMRR